MCTGLTLKTKDEYTLFGRNMDLAYQFNQSVIITPRNFKYIDEFDGKEKQPKYASMGMASIIDNFPCYADGFNEKGVACAGLNFPQMAYFESDIDDDKVNVSAHGFIFWVLSNFASVDEVKKATENLAIINHPLNENTPEATLHWMVTDTTGKSTVIENTKDGLKVFDNPLGVLTNSPSFDWHLMNLNDYLSIKPTQPENTNWLECELKPMGVGMGTKGLPGGYSGVDRFIRIAYLKSQIDDPENLNIAISQFNRMLQAVAMPVGAVISEGSDDITIYTSCMILQKHEYIYTTYNNLTPHVISMDNEDLDGCEIKKFEYIDELKMEYQN